MYPYRWIVQCFHAQQHMKRARSISTLLHEIEDVIVWEPPTHSHAQSRAEHTSSSLPCISTMNWVVPCQLPFGAHPCRIMMFYCYTFSIEFLRSYFLNEWVDIWQNPSFLGLFLAMNATNHLKKLKFLLKNILYGKLTKTYLLLTEIGHCLQQINFSSLQLHWNTSTFARVPHKKSVKWNCIY